MPMHLKQKRCVPCEGGAKPLSPEEVKRYLSEVPGWHGNDTSTSIERKWKFKSFKEAMVFINAVAVIAEEEHHHPDIHSYYNRVTLELSTHAIQGLSENDFILAAKMNEIA